MKPSKLVLLPAFAMMLPLAGCTFADDGWKEYYTPELFLGHAEVHNYVTVETEGALATFKMDTPVNMILVVSGLALIGAGALAYMLIRKKKSVK